MNAIVAVFAVCCAAHASLVHEGGILYPRESETRRVVSLDGFWNFVVAPTGDASIGFREMWHEVDISKLSNYKSHLMPVPSSYNDITVDPSIRAHVGLVQYQRTFFVPKSWSNGTRVWLRFSSVFYAAQVWVNKELVMSHEMGHLPFQNDVTFAVNFGVLNRLTVACDNTLRADTVPQGHVTTVKTDNGTKLRQDYQFDFYNYAGIDRPVTLYTTPPTYIDDISIVTDLADDSTTGHVSYAIVIRGESHTAGRLKVLARVLDRDSNVLGQAHGTSGTITVRNATLWWPIHSNDSPVVGYLHVLEVRLSLSGELLDVYRQPFGIRTVTWTDTSLLVNGRPVYLRGFGRHEDSDVRGRGFDLALVAREHEIIKSMGANAYRTSHYPYADETMDLADEMGIMIVDECPSVDTHGFGDALLAKHKRSLTELWQRDKNRPSVIMWSVANEPNVTDRSSDKYFEEIVAHVKRLDGDRRPVTLVNFHYVDYASKHVDIISWNTYRGWYRDPGDLDNIVGIVESDVEKLHRKYKKPVLVTEYGADTISGAHTLPSSMWTEDFQVQLLSKHFVAFDELRKKGFFVGEFIWNFADFETREHKNTLARPGGNLKGIFTRNRQPKASAHLLRTRYQSLLGNKSDELFCDRCCQVC